MVHRLLVCFSWFLLCRVCSSSIVVKDEFVVPVMEGEEMRNGERDEELRRILTSTGILSIRVSPSQREATLNQLCTLPIQEFEQVSTLTDSTDRYTLATATYGMHRPLPLPSSQTPNTMEELRRVVADTSILFQQALDRLLDTTTTTATPLMTNAVTHQPYHSVTEIVSKATNLEHFHRYHHHNDNQKEEEEAAVTAHVDAGLFLAFVPAMNCDDTSKVDTSLKVHFHGESPKTAILDPNSIVFMLGMGAQEWLATTLPLQATRHSLQLTTTTSRAWYGMMHLVPANAVIQTYPKIQTFADMKQSLVLSSQNNHPGEVSETTIGCASIPSPDITTTSSNTIMSRQVLEHVGDPSTCNNVTNFYCWMICQPIPEQETPSHNNNHNQQQQQDLHCLDPAIYDQTGSLEDAVNACRDPITGAIGGAMEDSCMGVWVNTQQQQQQDPTQDLPYCYGATSMLMQGFEWDSKICIVYLFSKFTLTSKQAMIGACFITVALGILLETILYARRRAIQSTTHKLKKIAYSTFYYSLQLTLGYALMLIIMTYHGPLVLSVILGIVSGHFLIQYTTYKTDNISIPDGSTPCCQNDLNVCTGSACRSNKMTPTNTFTKPKQQDSTSTSVEANHTDEESPATASDYDSDEEFYKNLPPCCQPQNKNNNISE